MSNVWMVFRFISRSYYGSVWLIKLCLLSNSNNFSQNFPASGFFFSQYIYLLTPSRNWEGWLWLHLEYIDVKYYVCCLDACTYGFDTYIYIIIYKPRNHLVNLILKLLHYEFILHPFRHEASQMNILRVKMLFGFDTYRITC